MKKNSFDEQTLKLAREIPIINLLDRLKAEGKIFWRKDNDFVPQKSKATVRLFLSSPSGAVWELLITENKWFDTKKEKGGGGSIDLVMHLLGFGFVDAVKFLLPNK